MELKCFRTLWGVTTPWPQTLDELQRVGCCGIEARVPTRCSSSSVCGQ
ncbi:xylose isomerase, partial [Klebsiella pneumoniae]